MRNVPLGLATMLKLAETHRNEAQSPYSYRHILSLGGRGAVFKKSFEISVITNRMHKKSQTTESQSTEICPNCNINYTRRTHGQISEKRKRQPYYFSEWDYCKQCRRTQTYEKYKVWNRNEMSEFIKGKEEMDSLFENSLLE